MVREIMVAGAILMANASMAQEPWEIAEQLDLVPTPQQIALDGGEFALEGWTIVTSSESEMIGFAAAEINDRIAMLGGDGLPISSAMPADAGAIVLGVWGDSQISEMAEALDVDMSADDPGPQGYVIATAVRGAQPVIACIGSDELGVLYAAVTLRHMIRWREGELVALRGSVRDWPDFRWRSNGSLDLRGIARVMNNTDDAAAIEAAVSEAKDAVDRFLRMKVNHVFGRLWALAADDEIRARQEEVVDYAAHRGMRLHFVGNTEIEQYLSEEQKQQAFEPRENRMYLWSALDAHREKAQYYADMMRELHGGMLAIHPVDSGAYVDPEVWSRRPEPDRERYGDDRAAASIEQFKIYFDAVRERSPETKLEAVSYPYHYQFALPDFPERYSEMNVQPYANWWRAIGSEEQAREVQQKLMEYHRRVAEALDDDVFITFREAGRDVFLACADLYPGHPIDIWTYPETYDGWHGTFFPQGRFAKSFVREDHDDYFFMAGGYGRCRDAMVCRMANAEYVWNADLPDGSADFTVESRLYAVGGQVTDYQRANLIPRIARALYGGAADVLTEVLAANISYNYVGTPAVVMSRRGEDDEDTFRYMAGQAEKMEALLPKLADLLDRIDAGEVAGPLSADIRDGPAYPWAVFYYKYTGLGAVKARLEAQAAEARRLLEAGERERAIEVAQAALDSLDEMARTVVEIHQRVAQTGVSMPAGGPACQALDQFTPAGFGERLQDVVEKCGAD